MKTAGRRDNEDELGAGKVGVIRIIPTFHT